VPSLNRQTKNFYLQRSLFGSRIAMKTDLLQDLASKEITKIQLLRQVEKDFGLVPVLLEGTSSSKATVRYGCGSTLVELSEKYPDKLYSYMDNFVLLLDGKHRILTWNALAAIASLTIVDSDRKFDAIFDKYYSFLGSEYMVTVANVVANSAKIVANKPYLADKITMELLKVNNLQTTSHLTQECRLVIAEKTLQTFNTIIKLTKNTKDIVAFAQKHQDSARISLKKEVQNFLGKQTYNFPLKSS
jgi:hypothetical protein